MHELSIAQALVGQIRNAMEQEGARRACNVTVAVGALSGVERHALEMAFPLAAGEAGLDGLDLHIEKVPSKVRCRECDHEFSPETPLFLCEECGSAEVDIIAGRELSIRSLEVED